MVLNLPYVDGLPLTAILSNLCPLFKTDDAPEISLTEYLEDLPKYELIDNLPTKKDDRFWLLFKPLNLLENNSPVYGVVSCKRTSDSVNKPPKEGEVFYLENTCLGRIYLFDRDPEDKTFQVLWRPLLSSHIQYIEVNQ